MKANIFNIVKSNRYAMSPIYFFWNLDILNLKTVLHDNSYGTFFKIPGSGSCTSASERLSFDTMNMKQDGTKQKKLETTDRNLCIPEMSIDYYLSLW